LLASVTLNGTDNADTILIERVSSNIRVTINGTATNVNTLDFITVNGVGGNDSITVRAGDLDTNCPDDMTLLGGAGDDLLVFDDTTDTGDDHCRLVNNTLEKAILTTFTGDVATFSESETVEFRSNPGGNAINATTAAGTVRLRLIGNDGADAFTLTPSPTVILEVQGNAPSTAPGDALTIVNVESADAASLVTGGIGLL
jgi:hypothetical protein